MRKCIICFLLAAFILTGCAKKTEDASLPYENSTIRIAKQFGMQYAPVYVTAELGLLEKYLPGIKVEWASLGGGSAISEALIANKLDVAFMGIPPMVIAWDKGADFKIASGICVPPSELMVKDPSIKSLSDFKKEHKIAVPSIGSIQHIMLAMACKTYLGNAKALDNNIVPMANPDAFSALISGTEVVSHFASMPYIDKEASEGFKSILSGKDAFGDASIICVTSKTFHDNEPILYSIVQKCLAEAICLINEQDPRVIEIIAKTEKLSADKVVQYLNWPGTNYSTVVYGAMSLSSFMAESGYITKKPVKSSDLMWDSAAVVVGKRTGNPSAVENIQ